MKKFYFILSTFISLTFFGQFPDWKYLSQSDFITSAVEYGPDIWIGNYSGLIQLNKTTGAKTYYDKTNSPLPDNCVRAIAIDVLGTKWIGTDQGLVKYDGISWSVYTTTNSPLPTSSVRHLSCDASNNVWISTGSGLLKFNGTTWSVYTTSTSAIPSNYIGCLFAEGNNVWMGHGPIPSFTKFDGTTWTAYNNSNTNISNSNVLDITKDKLGNIWLLHYDCIEKYTGTNTLTIYNSTSTGLNSITTDTNNIVWVGCTTTGTNLGGFKSFNGSTWSSYDSSNTTYNYGGINHLLIDATNIPWGFGAEGLVHQKNGFNITNTNIDKVSFHDRWIRKVDFDKNGYPFVGTKANSNEIGLYKYDWMNITPLNYFNDSSFNFCADTYSNIFIKNKFSVYKYNGTSWASLNGSPPCGVPVSMSLPDFSCMTADTLGGLWMDYLAAITINTITSSPVFHEGLAYHSGSSWATYCYTNSALPDVAISCIKANKKTNDIWLGTSGGLVKFDKTNWSVYTPTAVTIQKSVGSFDIDSLGNVWYANGSSGLVKFDGTNYTNFNCPFPSGYGGADISIDRSGTIWQRGTGMYLIGFDGISWTLYDYTNSAMHSFGNATHLAIDKFDNKWLSTGNGLFVFKQGGVYSLSNGGKEKELAKAEVLVYPNPSSEKFNIKLDKNYQKIELSLFNSIGQEVLKTSYLNTNLVEIKNNLAKGVYIYYIKVRNADWTGKLIAE